jgi:hypothetical protein
MIWLKKSKRYKRRLKIPKMVFRGRSPKKDIQYNEQNNNDERADNGLKAIQSKLEVEKHNPSKSLGVNQVLRKGKQYHFYNYLVVHLFSNILGNDLLLR